MRQPSSEMKQAKHKCWGGVLLCALFTLPIAAAESVSFTVQKVEASREGDPDKPTLPATLREYAQILKGLGYGTYRDLGHESKVLAEEQSTSVVVDAYSVTLTAGKIDARGGTALNYTIMKGMEKVGGSALTLKPGSPQAITIGNSKNPFILLFK